MKLTNFVFGIIIFSIVTTLMFAGVQSILTDNDVGDPSEWEALSGGYGDFVAQTGSQDNSTTRGILDQTKVGRAKSEGTDITLLSGAVSGGRLSFNFFTNFNDVITKVRGDTDTFIDPRIWAAIIALAIVFLALVVLHFLRGFKTEV